MNTILRALKHRHYRAFFIGQSISWIGTWMQTIAVSWMVYRLTGSAIALGLVGFISQIPVLFVSPFAGVIVDQSNRHKLLIWTQTLCLLEAVVLTVLTVTGQITLFWVYLLSFLLGIVNAFDMPSRQSFFVTIVENKEDLGNAIALNSSIFNVARLIGPSIAGILIAWGGELLCFVINALSFVPVIWVLLSMKIYAKPKPATSRKILPELKEGFAYLWGNKPIRLVLVMLAFVSLVTGPYMTLMPIFAKSVLGGGPKMLGFLVAAAGLGALIGALYIAAVKSIQGLGKIVAATSTIYGAGLLGFSLSTHFAGSAFFLVIAGFGMMASIAGSNTIIQSLVIEPMRGRMMSLFSMALVGTAPIGSFVYGILADNIGAPYTLAMGAVFCLLASAIFGYNLKKMESL